MTHIGQQFLAYGEEAEGPGVEHQDATQTGPKLRKKEELY